MKVAVIGGGAAGFFAAFSVKHHHPGAQVCIFEKTNKLLAKVKVSGGGRCNVTNACPGISELAKAYPRGGKQLKKLFGSFNNHHTMEWFSRRGVALKTEENGHVFPVTNDSQTIIDCFLNESKKLGIEIKTGININSIIPGEDKLTISLLDSETLDFNKAIVATGGSPKRSGLEWLEKLGHLIEDPVPSLFSFNMPGETIKNLMGVAVEKTVVKIQGTKLTAEGPLLITHWGMSGPAILKLSSFGARQLAEMDYSFNVQVNWANEQNFEVVYSQLENLANKYPKKILSNQRPYPLPERLWNFLLEKSGIEPTKKWAELGKKGCNKLSNTLTNDIYMVRGKTTFKDEFVTCGGVSLQSVDMSTLQSRVIKNLYFAGEVLDIDAITGGYNFQAAWTTGFMAGRLED